VISSLSSLSSVLFSSVLVFSRKNYRRLSHSRGASVQLSEDQRSRFKTIIGKERGPRLGGNVNFDVTVGTRIPRNVHVVVLPEEIVRIVPEYRGYEYFLVGDEIVVVDPSTLEIVAIIPA
jgi:hypothetical protein